MLDIKKYRVDLHNHTKYCNHATGTVEEYVKKAIDLEIDFYGFSEHAPMNFDYKYRLSWEDMNFYNKEIKYVKNKYRDKINILKAFEVDWLPKYMDDNIFKENVDYFIGSVHFLDNWGFDNPEFIGGYKNKNIDDIWIKYFEEISNMVKSNKFDIVGHLDLLKVFKFLPKKDIRTLAKQTLLDIKKYNMVVEINTAGLRKPIEEIYPSKLLLEEIYNLGINITFSSDAHNVQDVGKNYFSAKYLAEEIGFKKVAIFKERDKKFVNF